MWWPPETVDLSAAPAATLPAMNALVQSLRLAVGQLADAAVLRVLGKSLLVTLAIFVALGWALAQALPWLLGDYVDLAGDTYVVLSTLIILLAGWFLFRIVAIAVLQFFADEIVIAVERKHYPDAAARAKKLPFRQDLSNSLRGIGRTLLFNAIALPVALILLFTAIGPAIVFLLVNAVLLGRELTDMPWLRHRADPAEQSPVGRVERIALGAAVAGLMAVPFANFLAPVIGAAAGTHLFQLSRIRQTDA